MTIGSMQRTCVTMNSIFTFIHLYIYIYYIINEILLFLLWFNKTIVIKWYNLFKIYYSSIVLYVVNIIIISILFPAYCQQMSLWALPSGISNLQIVLMNKIITCNNTVKYSSTLSRISELTRTFFDTLECQAKTGGGPSFPIT